MDVLSESSLQCQLGHKIQTVPFRSGARTESKRTVKALDMIR